MEFIEYGETITGEKLFARIDEDGLIRYTCIESDPAYQAWLNPEAAQSTPIDTEDE
jgi:hypothetical protein